MTLAITATSTMAISMAMRITLAMHVAITISTNLTYTPVITMEMDMPMTMTMTITIANTISATTAMALTEWWYQEDANGKTESGPKEGQHWKPTEGQHKKFRILGSVLRNGSQISPLLMEKWPSLDPKVGLSVGTTLQCYDHDHDYDIQEEYCYRYDFYYCS